MTVIILMKISLLYLIFPKIAFAILGNYFLFYVEQIISYKLPMIKKGSLLISVGRLLIDV